MITLLVYPKAQLDINMYKFSYKVINKQVYNTTLKKTRTCKNHALQTTAERSLKKVSRSLKMTPDPCDSPGTGDPVHL